MPGSYVIKPIEAKLNKECRFNKEMKPFCEFIFGAKQFKTDAANLKGENPCWDSSITILSDADTSSNLRLDVKDKKDESALGNCQINLKEIEHQGHFRNWYPLRCNNKDVGQILLDTTFEEDINRKNKNYQGSKDLRGDKQFVSQADASDKSRVNEARNRNEIKEGQYVTEGMMTEKRGEPFMMSDKQREMYNQFVPQGLNENMEQPQWTKRSEVNDQLLDKGQFRTSEQNSDRKFGGFGDNIGTNQQPIENKDLSANRRDDLEGNKPSQLTSTKNELNNQGRGEARAEGGLTKTEVYSETQSHIGNKMNLGLIEKQNQPQKTASGMNAGAERIGKNISPSREQKFRKGDQGNLGGLNKEREELGGISQPKRKFDQPRKGMEGWDEELIIASDKTGNEELEKEGLLGEDKQCLSKDQNVGGFRDKQELGERRFDDNKQLFSKDRNENIESGWRGQKEFDERRFDDDKQLPSKNQNIGGGLRNQKETGERRFDDDKQLYSKNQKENLEGRSRDQKEFGEWKFGDDKKLSSKNQNENLQGGLREQKEFGERRFEGDKQLGSKDQNIGGLRDQKEADQRKEVSGGMQSNYAGGSKNQNLMGQNPIHKVELKEFDA